MCVEKITDKLEENKKNITVCKSTWRRVIAEVCGTAHQSITQNKVQVLWQVRAKIWREEDLARMKYRGWQINQRGQITWFSYIEGGLYFSRRP